MVELTQTPFKRKKYDIVFSHEIERSVFHPVVLQYHSQALEARGVDAWAKNHFLTLLSGITHLWTHDQINPAIQKKIDQFDFPTPMERNHVLYFSLLSPIYNSFFEEALVTRLKSRSMSYVEEQGWQNIIEDVCGINVSNEADVDKNQRERLKAFFSN